MSRQLCIDKSNIESRTNVSCGPRWLFSSRSSGATANKHQKPDSRKVSQLQFFAMARCRKCKWLKHIHSNICGGGDSIMVIDGESSESTVVFFVYSSNPHLLAMNHRVAFPFLICKKSHNSVSTCLTATVRLIFFETRREHKKGCKIVSLCLLCAKRLHYSHLRGSITSCVAFSTLEPRIIAVQ